MCCPAPTPTVISYCTTDGRCRRGLLRWYDAARTHLLMSVSKSIVGCAVGILIDRGVLPSSRRNCHVPDLRSSGYADASLATCSICVLASPSPRHTLTPDATLGCWEQVMGWAPRRQDDLPTSIYDYLVRLKADRAHGGRFDCRSCETDVLGWVCERATGRRMPDLLSDLLWSRLGADGTPMARWTQPGRCCTTVASRPLYKMSASSTAPPTTVTSPTRTSCGMVAGRVRVLPARPDSRGASPLTPRRAGSRAALYRTGSGFPFRPPCPAVPGHSRPAVVSG